MLHITFTLSITNKFLGQLINPGACVRVMVLCVCLLLHIPRLRVGLRSLLTALATGVVLAFKVDE